jgi:8-oxo-dGTP pyrophosphatase MutT (NUDIX family)
MSEPVEKVTAFIIRETKGGHDLLLFRHPHAGVQIPAGAVEDGETPEEAVLREAQEETGLKSLSIRRYLGCAEHRFSAGERMVVEPTMVHARPDLASFGWAHFRRGIVVTPIGRASDGLTQVTYEEFDREPDPQYVTMRITGWVPDDVLTDKVARHFFLLESHEQAEEQWTVHTDCHAFALFWAPLSDLPEIAHSQDTWLEFLASEFASQGKE